MHNDDITIKVCMFYCISGKFDKSLGRFLEKVIQSTKSNILIKTPDHYTSEIVNNYLWSYESLSFLPHAVYFDTNTIAEAINARDKSTPINELYENITERYMIHNDFHDFFLTTQRILISHIATNKNNPSIFIILHDRNASKAIEFIQKNCSEKCYIFFANTSEEIAFAQEIWNNLSGFKKTYWAQES